MPIRVVFLDCDGTLTKIKSSWEYLHRRLNLWDNNADAYQTMFRNGRITYEEFCARDALLWKGMAVPEIEKIVQEIPLRDDAVNAVLALKDLGIYTIIISSGLSFLINRVMQMLSIDRAFSNELETSAGLLTGKTTINVPYNRKGPLVQGLLDSMGVNRADSCAVGDGDGDAGMFEQVGLPIHLFTEESSDDRPNGRCSDLLTAVNIIARHGR